MRHLTNLVLSLRDFKAGILNMTNLHFPALVSIDIIAHTAPLGLTRFVAKHSELLHLHLNFGESFVPGPFQAQDLPQLQALKMSMDSSRTFATFLGKRSESAEVTCARRPSLEHLHIYLFRSIRYLNDYILCFGGQLRRLDLQPYDEKHLFRDEFCNFLKSFTALVELSITLPPRILDSPGRASVLSISQLVRLARSPLLMRFSFNNNFFLARIPACS